MNGQKVTNYFYSTQYQDLKKQSDELAARFLKTQHKIEKYPDDQDFKAELLTISDKQNAVYKLLDSLTGSHPPRRDIHQTPDQH